MKKFFFVIVFLFSLNAFSYTVQGSQECGDIIYEDRMNNDMMYQAVTSWLQGYITARNFITDSDKGADFHSLYFALLNFCKDFPLKDIDDAAIFIYSTL